MEKQKKKNKAISPGKLRTKITNRWWKEVGENGLQWMSRVKY
jgi:hypothetical protein